MIGGQIGTKYPRVYGTYPSIYDRTRQVLDPGYFWILQGGVEPKYPQPCLSKKAQNTCLIGTKTTHEYNSFLVVTPFVPFGLYRL